MKTRRNVRGIVYSPSISGPRFLLLLARKGYWQNPNGGQDDGEGEVEAVLREVSEETGLQTLRVLEHTRAVCEYDAERRSEPIHVHLVAYLVEADGTEPVTIGRSEDKHTDYRWVSYREALEMLDCYPEQRPVFDEVCRKGGLARSGP